MSRDQLPPLTASSYLSQKSFQLACMDPALLAAALADGRDPNEPFDINGHWTPLHCALSGSPPHPDCIRMLLAAGADPNGIGLGLAADGKPPIVEAFSRAHNGPEHMAAAEALAHCPALLPLPEDLLGLAFHAPQLVPALAERGFDPNAPYGAMAFFGALHARPTCLAAALVHGSIDSHLAALALLAAGADPNGTDPDSPHGGMAPLSACLRREATRESIQALLDAGADPRRRDADGKDALDLAREAQSKRPHCAAAAMRPLIESIHTALCERDAMDELARQVAPERPSLPLSL